ncbi:MAG: hypothetical protein CMF12_08515 [Idiomarina sp.]|uniref:hypothetical protein n=1 Tax=Idiomarina sp. TaxID=1874361 RepID=UPI000C5CBB7F|nr:hypothetical protein [Idiomarina sp.]MBT42552.1 hypothetical protein [Idiomarina sp.]
MTQNYWIAPSFSQGESRSCGVPKVFEFLGYRIAGDGMKDRVFNLPVYSCHDGQTTVALIEQVNSVIEGYQSKGLFPSANYNMLPLHYGHNIIHWHKQLRLPFNARLPKGWAPTRNNSRIALIGGRSLDQDTADNVIQSLVKLTTLLSGAHVITHTCSEFTTTGERLKLVAQKSNPFSCLPIKANWDTFGKVAYKLLNYELVYDNDFFVVLDDHSAESFHALDVVRRFQLPHRVIPCPSSSSDHHSRLFRTA